MPSDTAPVENLDAVKAHGADATPRAPVKIPGSGAECGQHLLQLAPGRVAVHRGAHRQSGFCSINAALTTAGLGSAKAIISHGSSW